MSRKGNDPGDRFPGEWNARLRRLVADLSLDKEMLTEVIRKKI